MTSCSETARGLGEPLAGSAPWGQVWLALEQPGPWGRAALLDSHLPIAVGRALTARADGRPIRVQLIRRPGAHPDTGAGTARTVLVARTFGQPRLWRASVDDPHDVLDIDVEAVLNGAEPGLGAVADEPVALVCTNGRRDLCCARHGRAAATRLAAAGLTVWETSHLGGHRFSPTFVRLPDGWVFGGPDAVTMSVAAARGRSALAPDAQAAELAVLADLGATAPTALPLSTTDRGSFVVDERHVTVHWRETVADRPESCGKGPVPAASPVAVVQP